MNSTLDYYNMNAETFASDTRNADQWITGDVSEVRDVGRDMRYGIIAENKYFLKHK